MSIFKSTYWNFCVVLKGLYFLLQSQCQFALWGPPDCNIIKFCKTLHSLCTLSFTRKVVRWGLDSFRALDTWCHHPHVSPMIYSGCNPMWGSLEGNQLCVYCNYFMILSDDVRMVEGYISQGLNNLVWRLP